MFMARRQFLANTGILAAGALWHRWPVAKIKDTLPMRIENSVNGLKEDGCNVVFFAKDANYVLTPVGKQENGWQRWSCLKDGEFVECLVRQLGTSVDVQWFQHCKPLERVGVGITGTERIANDLFRHGVSTVQAW
jgi:hypothetical protein